MKFYLVDVFAQQKYSGNQLAVIPDAESLSTEKMIQITREFNFSETTFITGSPDTEDRYPVRIFTPAEEVPFAGHPTVGTAWVIRNLLREDLCPSVTLNLQVGAIPVAFDDTGGLAIMTTKAPSFGNQPARESVASVLGLTPEDLDPCHPVQVVSTGLPALIVPVACLEAVQRIRVDVDQVQALAQATDIGKVMLVFCPETIAQETQLHVRVFCPLVNIAEDPATGSANSCLAGYLVKHRYFHTDTIDIQVEQGLEIQRPSRLHLKAEQGAQEINIQVGGQVQLIAEGTLK